MQNHENGEAMEAQVRYVTGQESSTEDAFRKAFLAYLCKRELMQSSSSSDSVFEDRESLLDEFQACLQQARPNSSGREEAVPQQ